MLRIQEAVSDLHVADARCHLNCRTKFTTERAMKAASTSSSSGTSCQDEAFEQALKTMHSGESTRGKQKVRGLCQ